MTPAQARAQRAQLEREIRREEKRKDRARLVELRARVRRDRLARVRALYEARAACKRRRGELPTLREAAAILRAAKAEARAQCTVDLEAAKRLRDVEGRARAEHAAELTHQRAMRRIERQNKERGKERRPRLARASVRRQESDDEVRHNIPPELVYLWDRVKRQIRGTDRMTRTEAFLHYAEEHPDEELAALEDKTDALIRELEARERGTSRRARANPKKKTRDTGAQRSLFIPPGGQLEIIPSHEQKQLRAQKLSAEARTVPLFKNPRPWWDECIAQTSKRGVRAVLCKPPASWWRLPLARREAIVRRLGRSKHPRERAAAIALAHAEQHHMKGKPCPCPKRKQNPREVVEIVYLEQKPGDREPFEYEHTFEGDRPALEMRGGKAQLRGGSYFTRDGWLHG